MEMRWKWKWGENVGTKIVFPQKKKKTPIRICLVGSECFLLESTTKMFSPQNGERTRWGIHFFLIDKNAHVHLHMGFVQSPHFFFFPFFFWAVTLPLFLLLHFFWFPRAVGMIIVFYLFNWTRFFWGHDFYFFNKFGFFFFGCFSLFCFNWPFFLTMVYG